MDSWPKIISLIFSVSVILGFVFYIKTLAFNECRKEHSWAYCVEWVGRR